MKKKERIKKKFDFTKFLSLTLNVLLVIVLACSAFWVFSYKNSKDGEIRRLNELIRLTEENNIIIPIEDFKEYATRYGLMTQFSQRYFPDYLVYPGYSGIQFLPLDEKLPKNPLDFTKITFLDDRPSLVEGDYRALLGVDVSVHQGDIDWKKVKDDGIDFAFIRVGYRGYDAGGLNLDSRFHANIAEANKVGLPVGVYFFSGAINEKEAIEEANYVLRNIKGYRVDLAIAFDMEDVGGSSSRMKKLTPQEKTAIAKAFCDHIEKAGYQAIIYGNAKWLLESLDYNEVVRYGIWFANYNYFHWPYKLYAYQYTSSGKVEGIKGRVDMNLGFFNYPD